MRKSFLRLSAEFQKEFKRKLSFRTSFEKEFYKRFTTTPQRNAARDRGSLVTVEYTDYYLLPPNRAIPAPTVVFEGVELTTSLTPAERQWLEKNIRRHGWSALVGYRMGNPDLLTYFREYDHYAVQ